MEQEPVIEVHVVGSPLPISVKRKWQWAKENTCAKFSTLEDMEIKLAAAEQRRQVHLKARCTSAPKQIPRKVTEEQPAAALAQRLQQRLASADRNRRQMLADKRSRAASCSARAAQSTALQEERRSLLGERLDQGLRAAEAARDAQLAQTAARAASCAARTARAAAVQQSRKEQLATKLQQGLKAAEAARDAHLAETAARAARRSARARETASSAKLQAELELSRRRAALAERMERAARSRSQHARCTEKPPLPLLPPPPPRAIRDAAISTQSAARSEQQRRTAACRTVQRFWRAFSAKQRTSAALVADFQATGILQSVPLAVPPPPPQPVPERQPALTQQPSQQQFSAGSTPLATPAASGCASPSSTLPMTRPRGGGGRGTTANSPQGQTLAHTPSRATSPVLQYHAVPYAVPPPNPATPPLAAQPTSTSVGSPVTHPISHRRTPLARSAASVAEASAPSARVDSAPAPPSIRQHIQQAAAAAGEAARFDEFAAAMSAPATLRAAQALLRRIQAKVSAGGCASGGCEALVRRHSPRRSPRGQLQYQERYPTRTFLCAFMILAHPEVVLNQRGPMEETLTEAASEMAGAFGALLSSLESFPPQPAAAGDVSAPGLAASRGEQERPWQRRSGQQGGMLCLLRRFDAAWVRYLEQFVAWKGADAAGLEGELVRVSVELERSRLAKLREAAVRVRSQLDVQALMEGVDADLALIRDRVQRLTGPQGVARLEAALAAARASAAAAAASAPSAAAGTADDAAGATAASGPKQQQGTTEGVVPPPASCSSSSPAKKMPRRNVQHSSITIAEDSSPVAAERAVHAVDVEAALAQHDNLALMWQLLFDPGWRLPTADLEQAWRDATGETNPMADATPIFEDFPSPMRYAVALHAHMRRIAEAAFWDAAGQRLGSSAAEDAQTAAGQAAGMLAQIGASLAGVLPAESEAVQEVRSRLGSEEALLRALLPPPGMTHPHSSLLPGVDATALFDLLDWSAALLRRFGAPARHSAALKAHAEVRTAVGLAGSAEERAAVAARALRLLSVQLKLMRMDAANAQLQALSAHLGPQSFVAYAQQKFEAILGPADLPTEDLSARLPHTRGWLAVASGQLPAVEQLLQGAPAAVGAAQPAAAAAATSSTAPALLRSGRHSSAAAAAAAAAPRASSATPASVGAAVGLLLLPAASARSWCGLVRCGLVQLASGEGAVASEALPETLRLDAGRLAAAQNEFQRLVVLTACLLILHQHRQYQQQQQQQQGSVPSSAGGDVAGAAVSPRGGGGAAEAAKLRLAAVLADPRVHLADLAAELDRLITTQEDQQQYQQVDRGTELLGAPAHSPKAVAAAAAAAWQREEVLQERLRRLLSRGGGGLRAVTTGIRHALLVILLCGPVPTAGQARSSAAAAGGAAFAERAVHAALARCGASALADEVATLGASLAAVAAVTEGVAGAWYRHLSIDLL